MCDKCADPDLWFSTEDVAPPGAKWGTGIYLRLQRHVPSGAGDASRPRGQAVLLLHGGSANHRTFRLQNGLADWLFSKGLDPWLLDWRGSSLVSDCESNLPTLQGESTLYNFTRAAEEDLPAAIAMMRRRNPSLADQRIALVGHCMGAAVIAEAVARGSIAGQIDRIVLLALGLFYEAAIDSRVKSEERILERLTRPESKTWVIDPRVEGTGEMRRKWPADLDKLFEAWPGALRAHDEPTPPTMPVTVTGTCNRITFMYGMPYRHDNLVARIEGPGDAELPDHFGGFPIQMYLHAARNLRAGQATTFDPKGPQIDWSKARNRFIELTNVTLITGALNRLWHRDSIDRMHEWLCRGHSTALRKIRKHVLPRYAHQDLLWGKESPSDVYPLIGEGLGLPGVIDDTRRSGSAPPSHT